MADLEMKMKLRRFALDGNEWALDMLIADAEVSALKGAIDDVHQRLLRAFDTATALNEAETLKSKTAKG